MKSKNKKLAKDFMKFCEDNPELRFWQALAAWSRLPNIVAMGAIDGKIVRDTFYFEYKDR